MRPRPSLQTSRSSIAPWVLCLALTLVAAAPPDAVEQGQQAYERGDIAEALVQWSVALDLARREADGATELDLSLRLASAYRDIGRVATARALLARAEPLAEGLTGQGRWANAAGLLALGAGETSKAVDLFRRSFASHQEAKDPRGAAHAALNLGIAQMESGDPGARASLEAALELYTSLQDPSGRGDALTSLGTYHRQRRALEEAEAAHTQAIASFEVAKDAKGVADASVNLALVLIDMGRVRSARTLAEAAQADARARLDVRRQARVLEILADLDLRASDIARAQANLAAARDAYEEVGATARALWAALRLQATDPTAEGFSALLSACTEAGFARGAAVAHLNLAALSTGEDRLAHAQSARELAEVVQAQDLWWRALAEQGAEEVEQGRTAAGIATLEAAAAIVEREALGAPRLGAEALLTNRSTPFTSLIAAQLGAGRTLDAAATAERLHRLESGVVGPEALPEPSVHALAAIPATLSARLEEALGQEEASEEDLAQLRIQIGEAHATFADAVDRLRADNPDLALATEVAPEDLQAIQRSLPRGVLVLQPVVLPDRVVLMALTRASLRVLSSEVDQDTFERQVSRLTRSLRAEHTQDPGWTRELCDELGRWLLQPLAEEIDRSDTVVVAKSGALRQLPFAMLRLEGKYLVERAAVASVTHVGSLAPTGSRPRFRLSGPDLGLLGNPDGTLPGAQAEVEALAGRFPGADLRLGPTTLDDLGTLARGKVALHLATHGVIDPNQPTQSYLSLGPDEARLAYRHIPRLAPDLDGIRLVVLSACESGLPVTAVDGDHTSVVMSIDGLAAQFRRAGVETLLATLWRVDDAGTQTLMTRFYEQLARGQDIATSLRIAQLALIAEEETAHPWFWAGFSVVGDWRT